MLKDRRRRRNKGQASWLATYSDLMNLLLCFFVMLYAMSNINLEKFQEIRSSFIGVGSGSNGILSGKEQIMQDGAGVLPDGMTESEVEEYYQNQKKMEAEELYQGLEQGVSEQNLSTDGISLSMDPDYNYVILNIEGAVLFRSGDTKLMEEALPVMSKVGDILKGYPENQIEIVGHTDNVPVKKQTTYLDNNELSSDRALSAFYYLVEQKGMNPAQIKYSGRGEYEPIADNATEEGRQKNRRIEIRVYVGD